MNSCSERLSPEQTAKLAMAICATAETLGQTLSPTAADMMAQDLAEYPASMISGALQACRRELVGRLTLAAILQRIQANDGRPAANEAWAIARQSYDEAETVLMTPEIRQAAAAAAPVAAARDWVGARMAFISAYERLVADARKNPATVTWSVSLGHSQERRTMAITEAVRLGRLPATEGQALLAQHSIEPITPDGRAVAGLLTGTQAVASPSVREKLAGIKQILQDAKKRRTAEQEALAMARKRDLDQRIARHEQAVQELMQRRAGA